MIKHPHQTPSESAADQKERERRMRRYDAHMNKHGHYSMLAKPNQGRSAILDQILRSGGTLQSDYLERMGPPPDLETEEPATPNPATPPAAEAAATPSSHGNVCPVTGKNTAIAKRENRLATIRRPNPITPP